MMTPARLREIDELYYAVRKRGRQALAEVDLELRREVEKLLAQDSGASRFIPDPGAAG
jgi:hypothetical protein